MATFANESRGLKIRGSDFVYLTEGAYSVIFVDRRQSRIRKVYRVQRGLTRSHCEEVFDSEVEAYNVAGKTLELRALVPRFYGICNTTTIVDSRDQDVSREFLGNLTFEAEFIPSEFIKIGNLECAERKRIIDLFVQHGIRHIVDSSVCVADGKIIKIVDFAVFWMEPWHEDF